MISSTVTFRLNHLSVQLGLYSKMPGGFAAGAAEDGGMVDIIYKGLYTMDQGPIARTIIENYSGTSNWADILFTKGITIE